MNCSECLLHVRKLEVHESPIMCTLVSHRPWGNGIMEPLSAKFHVRLKNREDGIFRVETRSPATMFLLDTPMGGNGLRWQLLCNRS
jgi:hypothetical protein